MTPAEALAASTVNAAWVLGRHGRLGRLAPGYDGDVVLLEADDWRHLAYHLGGAVVHADVQAGRRAVNELARRLRELPVADAVGLAGLGMLLVGRRGHRATALVEAARSTPGASLLDWYDRLLLGLWEFRIEHTVWFTARAAGAVVGPGTGRGPVGLARRTPAGWPVAWPSATRWSARRW